MYRNYKGLFHLRYDGSTEACPFCPMYAIRPNVPRIAMENTPNTFSHLIQLKKVYLNVSQSHAPNWRNSTFMLLPSLVGTWDESSSGKTSCKFANLNQKGGSYVPCGRYWLRGARVEMRFTGTE